MFSFVDVPILLLFNYFEQGMLVWFCAAFFFFFFPPSFFISSGLVQFICIACGVSSPKSCLGHLGSQSAERLSST